jgi:hypothetical protein
LLRSERCNARGASHEIEGITGHEGDGRSWAWHKYWNVLRWNDADLVHDVTRVSSFLANVNVLEPAEKSVPVSGDSNVPLFARSRCAVNMADSAIQH